MNTNIKSKTTITAVVVTVCAIISVILRCVNFFFFYDEVTGYYVSGAPLPIIADCLLGAAVVFLLVFSLVFFRKKPIEASQKPYPLIIVSASLGIIASLALSVTDLLDGGKYALLFAILGLATAIYFIMTMVRTKDIFKIIFGFLAIIKIVTLLASSYFNYYVGINSPDKILFGLACVSAMLFIVNELKLTVGSNTHLYIFASGSTTLLCLVSSVPSIIAYHAKLLPAENGMYFEYYLLLCFAIYAAICFFTALLGPKEASKPEITDGQTENQQIDCEEKQ